MVISTTSFDKFLQLSQQKSFAVVTMEILGDRYTPVNVFQSLADNASQAILLDTSDYRKHSPADAGVFIGLDPIANFIAHGHQINVTMPTGIKNFHSDYPFQALRDFYHQFHCYSDQPLAKFAGGIIGFMSHDAVRLIEKIPNRHVDVDKIPDLHFTCYGTHIIFDRRTAKILLAKLILVGENKKNSYENALKELRLLKEKVEKSNQFLPDAAEQKRKFERNHYDLSSKITQITMDSDDEAYGKMVDKAKEYIRQGDAFQIVPSRRFQRPFQGNDFNIYRALKALNPSPYMFYLRYPHLSIIGASPEKLISLQNGVVQITPIAGSRPRGVTPEEDEILMSELLEDGKELAEHMMLIDLARNDVGRVCEPGTVSVVESKIINKFSHIMHLTSIVEGKLRSDCDVFDVLQSGFPAGTLTGAPKIRATQIIDEIEQSRRGLYGGAICTIDNKGQLDSCIIIRTAVVKDNIATVRAGAGIVLDSNPVTEAEETRNKAKGVLASIELAEQVV